MRSFLAVSMLALVLWSGLAEPAAAQAGGPEAVIRTFSDRLLESMKGGAKLGFKGRAEKMRPAVAEAYDMPSMTRSTLGTAATKMSPDEAGKLAQAYSNFSVATYAAQFNEWNGERFEVGEQRPSAGGSVIVSSWLVPKNGDPTQIDYVMRQDQGQWRIIDVLFEGTVSQVAVRRSEFGSIFRSKGLDGLIETLEKQTAALDK
ncbi:HpnM family protein [Paramagnetospirillum magneticum]|uniref:ABC-type transport system involved in resistance to organic solvents, auxiliary component n=1 Tax=Paramagnetospirillum magneticum (strain ATCC 700264 / AMB-1) TaxID=342108 RepID=Q2W1I6_PARM1|nr:HpnM family protein [Paramagnetospirillum magneticum]BAE52289.1 ABC-type transport system involved in resistance to organic solvents, auxiliary component [Paramagnetospirillum magneticum AMB-1]